MEDLRQQSVEMLDHLVESTKLTLSQIATKAGLTPSTLTRFRNQPVKHQLSVPTVAKLKAAFPEHFSGEQPAYATAPRHTPAAAEDGSDTPTVELKAIDLGFSMGPGTNLDAYVEEDRVHFDTQLLERLSASGSGQLILAHGSGTSMEPTISDGDFFLFDRNQTHINLRDRIWACAIRGEGAVKRIRNLGNGRFLIISDNAALHPPEEVDEEDLRIFGRVIAVIRKQ